MATVLSIPIDDLMPYPGNARTSNVERLRESLRTLGQYRPITVREVPPGWGADGYQVLAGNHLMQAAQAEGYTHLDAQVVEVDDQQARRIVLMDNRATDGSSYDRDALDALLADLVHDDADDLLGSGYGELDYLDALERSERQAAARDAALLADEAPAAPEQTPEPRRDDTPADPATTPPVQADSRGLGAPVVSYTLVFDDRDQLARWYAFLKWLRSSGVPGDTIAARIDSHLAHTVPEDVS